MFTRLSQFTYGNYQIANIDTTAINNNTALLIHIQKEEENALRMVMGECLYNDLMDNVEKDANGYYIVKEDADDKWKWLVNGHSYDATSSSCNCGCGCDSGKCSKHVWRGLFYKVATVESVDVYESILAPYVFYQWSLNYRTLNTGVGEAKGIAQNTTQATASDKRVDAWNEFVQAISFGYPNSRVSLYQFLSEHRELFSDYQTVCLNTMTYWDI